MIRCTVTFAKAATGGTGAHAGAHVSLVGLYIHQQYFAANTGSARERLRSTTQIYELK